MKKILICIAVILSPIQILAGSFVTKEGVSVEYYTKYVGNEYGAVIGKQDNTTAISTDTEGAITIPDIIEVTYGSDSYSLKVIGIASRAFQSCNKLTSINLSSNVKEIEKYAFCLCSSLKTFSIPEGITTIEEAVFKNSQGLTSITIPESVTTIKESAFAGCSGLTSITIPENVTTIGGYAFAGCSGLLSITIPADVTTIGSYAFAACTSLTSFAIPPQITKIEDYTFSQCTGLTSFFIPNNVTSIGNSAYENCTNLTSLSLPKNIESIGTQAFYGCTALTSIYSKIQEPFALPNGVFKKNNNSTNKATLFVPYGKYNTYNSTSGWGTDVYINESSPTIGDTFTSFVSFGSDPVETEFLVTSESPLEVQIGYDETPAFPSGFTSNKCDIPTGFVNVDDYRFRITGLGKNAFKNCTDLTSLTIPNNITNIENAFSGCTNLNSVIVNWRDPKKIVIADDCFDEILNNAVLNVPAGTKDKYSEHEVWGNFAAIEEAGALSVGDISSCNGMVATLPIYLRSNDEIAGFQFRLILPEGVSAVEEDGEVVVTLTDRTNGFTVMGRRDIDEENVYLFVGLSLNGVSVSSGEDAIMNVKLNITDGINIGEYNIEMDEIYLSTSSYETLPDEKTWGELTIMDYMLGDANGDGKISITDAVGIVNYILGNASANFHDKAADVNGDGKISITDAVAVVNIILNQSAEVKKKPA